MISWIIKTSCLCYLPKPKAEADNTDLGFDNSWYHAQPHPIIVYYQGVPWTTKNRIKIELKALKTLQNEVRDDIYNNKKILRVFNIKVLNQCFKN